MTDGHYDRRTFLGLVGAAGTSAWFAATLAMISQAAEAALGQRDGGNGFAHLDEQVARDIEAIAEQIIPGDETPGARTAGVIWFIDAALGTFQRSWMAPIVEGVQQINDRLPQGKRFADLDWDQQSAMLRERETSDMFGMLHFLTVAGMFALPSYGGNRDKLGWQLLGFENRHAWQPPFGHYDSPSADGASR